MRYRPRNRRFDRRSRVRFEASAAPARRSGVAVVAVSPQARRVILTGMSLVLAAVTLTWFFGDTFRVKAVVVRGNDNVPATQVRGVSGLDGQHPLFINATAAAQAVSKLPGVSGVNVQCGWLGECVVTVRPSPPLAVYRTSSGLGDVWVDAMGKVQKVTGDIGARLSIRVEDGPAPAIGSPLDKRLMRAMTELGELQPDVAMYLYSDQFGIMFSDERGVRVRLGLAERDGAMQQKLALAQQLRGQLAERGIAPRVIDVRFIDAPFYIR